jgi:hypothetical protein
MLAGPSRPHRLLASSPPIDSTSPCREVVCPFCGSVLGLSFQEVTCREHCHSEQLRSLAVHGAKARLLELESEVAAISAAFPVLTGAIKKRSRSRNPAGVKRKRSKISVEGRRRLAEAQRKRWAALKSETATSQRPAKRASMSAAARKAVSERMKTYWAQRRAARKK